MAAVLPGRRDALDRACRFADRPFLLDSFSGRTLTYADSAAVAAALADELRVRGAGPGRRAALLLRNSAEFALLYLACLFGGATAVPVNPELHQREIDYILRTCRADLVVHSPSTASLLPQTGPDVPRWKIVPHAERAACADGPDLLAVPARTGSLPETARDASGLAAITYTSGTTGLPKGVAHTAGSLLGSAVEFNSALGIGPDHRFCHVLTMAYMAGYLNTLLCPWMAGASVVIAPPFNPLSLLRFWEPVLRFGADALWLSPTMAAGIARVTRDPAAVEHARRLRLVCVGTAPLPSAVRRAWEERFGVPLHESYGLSELLFLASSTPDVPAPDGSVGRPLPSVRLRFLDEAGASLPGGCEGEIAVATPFRMAGYLDPDSGLPDPAGSPEWFPTGDLGILDEDGRLRITARKKDLIIRGGLNVSPRAVEEALLEHPAVLQAAVIGLPHDLYGEEVAAVLVLRDGLVLDGERDRLERHARERLAISCVPTRWIQMDRLPASSTGKVQKQRLREMWAEASA